MAAFVGLCGESSRGYDWLRNGQTGDGIPRRGLGSEIPANSFRYAPVASPGHRPDRYVVTSASRTACAIARRLAAVFRESASHVMTDDREVSLSSTRAAVFSPTTGTGTLAALRLSAYPWAPFPDQAAWASRLKKILPELPGLRPLRVAILGNGTLGLFAETLRF